MSLINIFRFLYGYLKVIILTVAVLASSVVQAQTVNQSPTNKLKGESESELEIRNLSYLAQQTKTAKKALDEGRSSEIMRNNYRANCESFVERMLHLSIKLKTPTQARNFNQIKDFFAGFEPKLAAQIPTASMSKESGRRLASEK